VATALVAAGLVALEDREQLVADISVADRDAAAAEAVADAVARWRSVSAPEVRLNREQAVRLVVTQLRRAAATPVSRPVLSDGEAVELTAALQDVLVRDAMLAFVLPPWSEQLERLLVCVVRTTASHADSAAPLTLLAAVAWSRGQGARAAMLLDRALQADPDYRLAYLWDRGLRMGLPPTEIQSICRDAGRAVVRDLIGRMPRPPKSQRTRRAAGSD
jgi:hypothetical protein